MIKIGPKDFQDYFIILPLSALFHDNVIDFYSKFGQLQFCLYLLNHLLSQDPLPIVKSSLAFIFCWLKYFLLNKKLIKKQELLTICYRPTTGTEIFRNWRKCVKLNFRKFKLARDFCPRKFSVIKKKLYGGRGIFYTPQPE